MRISLLKDTSSKPSEILIHVEVSEIDDPLTYSHSFKYKVPSGTDKDGKAFGEIIIYTDKNASFSGSSFSFDLEKCRNKDCKEKNCPIAKPDHLLVTDIFHTRPKENNLQYFGVALFKALFSGYAGQLLQKTEPPHPNDGIYLQLNKHVDLDAIPWEYANNCTKFIVHQRIFARVHNRLPDQLPNLPLRIVAVVPDPIILPNEPGAALTDLHLNEQFRSFINGFTKNKKAVKLERVFPATVHQMDAQLMMERRTATVLHFMGHCGQKGVDGPRTLIFENKDNGKQEYVDSSRLVSTLDNLRLAFLSACDSRNIARVLFERGVPYTIGSNCPIPDDLAREFEFEFYKFLTGGSTVEMAMYRARKSIQIPGDSRRSAYFAGAMAFYSSKFGEDSNVFKCDDGDPDIKLHEPPHNLTELPNVSSFREGRRELSKLYTDLKRMVDRGTQAPHIYTIKGVGSQEFVVEAMRKMAHLFPGGIFAWAFDMEITSAKDYYRRLIEVMFPKGVWTQLMKQHSNNIQEIGSAIIKEFQTRATCLLILQQADILSLGEKERNVHAMELGAWLRRVASEQVKILATSSELLHWCTSEVMDLNDLMDPVVYSGGVYTVMNREIVHKHFAQVKEPSYFYGVPAKNLAFVERPDILENMEAALGKSGVCRILVLSGLGGMGKTQLMLRYCYLHRAAYEFVFWLEVDSWSVAIESFRKLAIKLGIDEESTKGEDAENKIIDWVCSWLQERTKWLLLLNNCDGDEMDRKVFELLPRIGGGSTIITTRLYIPSNKATVIHVSKMQEEEALFLLLGISSMASIDKESAKYGYAQEITAKLDYMPLAIALASAYVKNTATPIQRYLSMLQERKKRIKLFKYSDGDDYKHTVATVWQLSFERIRVLNPTAVQILEICAFLQPENIPVQFFKQHYSILQLASISSVSEHDDEEFLDDIETAVGILVRFSFVIRAYDEVENDDEDPASDLLTIHRLVQKVIYDSMGNDQILLWAHRIPAALKDKMDFSDHYAPRLRKTVDTYIWHIRHLVTVLDDLDQQSAVSRDLTSLLNNIIVYLWYNGRYFIMGDSSQLAVRFSEMAYGPEHSDTAKSLGSLALLYNEQGKYDEAELLYQRALVISEKVLGLEHPNTAITLDNMAGLYFSQGKYDKAEPLYQRALAICEKVLGLEHPDTATTLNNLAGLYVRQGKYGETEPLYQRALTTCENVLGLEHRSIAATLGNLARLYVLQGKYDDAEPLYQRALAIYEKVLELEHPDTATTLNNLAELYVRQGKYHDAEPLYQQALKIKKKVLGLEHHSTAITLGNLAGLYFSQGKYDKAEPLYQRALAICEKVLGSKHPDTATILNNLAGFFVRQGKYDNAEPLYQRALAIYEKVLGLEHPNTATTRNNFVWLYNHRATIPTGAGHLREGVGIEALGHRDNTEQSDWDLCSGQVQRGRAAVSTVHENVLELEPNTTVTRNNLATQ